MRSPQSSTSALLGLIDCAQSSADAASRQFAGAVIERTLAAADPAEVEADHRELPVREGVVELIYDLMVHRAAELRVRMKDDRDRRILLRCRVIPAFDPAGGASEDDFRHERYDLDVAAAADGPTACLTAIASPRNYLELF